MTQTHNPSQGSKSTSDAVKILFLDIDGVLVNRQSMRAARPPGDARTPFHPSCVEQLNRIIRETGCELVMSSTWRIDEKLSDMREFLQMRGISRPLLDFTSDMLTLRGLEIQKWLDQTPYPVQAFAILDDEADMGHLAPHLIRTKFEDGLTAAEADRAIALLNA